MVETTTLVAVAPLALLVPPLLLWACWSLLAYSWLQPSFWALSSTRKIGGRLTNLEQSPVCIRGFSHRDRVMNFFKNKSAEPVKYEKVSNLALNDICTGWMVCKCVI